MVLGKDVLLEDGEARISPEAPMTGKTGPPHGAAQSLSRRQRDDALPDQRLRAGAAGSSARHAMTDMNRSGRRKAVVLLSGGLDSMVTAALAREAGYSVLALTVNYNQRHLVELASARRIAAELGAERHVVLPIDLRAFGGSSLTDDIDVPKERRRRGGRRHPRHLCARAQHDLPVALARLGRGGRRARSVHRRQRARLFGLSRLPARTSSRRSSISPTSPPRPASRAIASTSTRRCCT